MLGIIRFPLALYSLPINGLTISNSLGLGKCLLMTFLLGMTQAHGFYSGFIEHTDSSATNSIVKIGRSESFALHVKV